MPLELIAVDQVQPADTVVLPQGRRCEVEGVDLYEDDTFVVRWSRPDAEHPDGVQLGSLAPMRERELVQVER